MSQLTAMIAEFRRGKRFLLGIGCGLLCSYLLPVLEGDLRGRQNSSARLQRS